MVELHIVPDSEADENGEPLASLGHNGPPPDVLPPSDARPSEAQAEYCAAIKGHVDELMAVALARAGTKKTKKWGASFHRMLLLGIACDIEIARRLPAQEETSHEKDRRQLLERLRKSFTEERDRDVHIATMVGTPELAQDAIARYDYRVSLLEAEFAYPARTTTFRFIAAACCGTLQGSTSAPSGRFDRMGEERSCRCACRRFASPRRRQYVRRIGSDGAGRPI